MSATPNIVQLTLLDHNRFEDLSASDLSPLEQDSLIGLALSVLVSRHPKGRIP